jgi:hypothetical protein
MIDPNKIKELADRLLMTDIWNTEVGREIQVETKTECGCDPLEPVADDHPTYYDVLQKNLEAVLTETVELNKPYTN